jgi:hypothetical protein
MKDERHNRATGEDLPHDRAVREWAAPVAKEVNRDRRNHETMVRVQATGRRFTPPWSVEEQSACFVVRDRCGQALAYVYFENEALRLASGKLLARDEARRIAANIAKLPRLLGKSHPSRLDGQC